MTGAPDHFQNKWNFLNRIFSVAMAISQCEDTFFNVLSLIYHLQRALKDAMYSNVCYSLLKLKGKYNHTIIHELYDTNC